MGGSKRWCPAVSRVAMALLLSGASSAVAQQSPQPPPPHPDRSTIEEPPKPVPPPPEPVNQGPAHVPPDASGINLSEIDTHDLELLYFDPAQTYLTPYIGRAFTNSLNFHKKKFNWTPWERITVLLKDFGDYGNAAARATPNNAVLLAVAPISQT